MQTDPLGTLKRLLEGRYRIDRELGQGGFATVYQVWNPRLDRAEALKVLAPGRQADEDFSQRFTQEVRLAAALEHPSIVKVYDFGQTEGIYWYSMQLVDGQTLSGELREKGPLSERETARITIPLLEALEYSHARGIVHRDIKPENVILDRDGRPFLMDFGIAKSAGSLVKTQTGFLLGTPAYVAPEQAQGKPLDGRADLYALGVTLYKVTSGKFPFEANDSLQAVILRLTQPPPPLAEARPGIDPAFASIVMRALEKEVPDRWESARAMRDALAAYLSGRPIEPRPIRALGVGERGAPPVAAPAPPSPAATVLDGIAAPASVAGPVRQARPPVPSGRNAPSSAPRILAFAAGGLFLLLALGGTGLVALRAGRDSASQSSAALPTAIPPLPSPAIAPTPTEVVAPAEDHVPTVAPALMANPTARSVSFARPTQPPEPPPPVLRRPVTVPERLTPDPPFAGSPPAGCSGAAVTVGFAVDAEGNVVAPRLLPSDAPQECGRFVLEALPRWKWRAAVDADGAPVLSARLVAYVQLP